MNRVKGRGLGMACNDQRDQSYIGFQGLTPRGFYNQWISSVYTWLFWYYLSYLSAGAREPDFAVAQAQSNAAIKITEWQTHPGIRWFALLVDYMAEMNKITDPALEAKLKDHILE